MNLIEIAAIIVFFVLLIVAIIFLLTFYICDNGKCKAFYCAEERGDPRGSHEHLMALLGEMGNDGVWCIPFIGASIMTALVFWFLEIEFTVRTFAIMWFVCFVVNYILFSFYNHHYLKPLTKYIIKELLAGKGCRCNKHEHAHDGQHIRQEDCDLPVPTDTLKVTENLGSDTQGLMLDEQDKGQDKDQLAVVDSRFDDDLEDEGEDGITQVIIAGEEPVLVGGD